MTYKDTVGKIGSNTKWKSSFDVEPTLEQYLALACDGDRKPAIKKIMPTISSMYDVIFYENCKGNMFNALKRQALEVTQPETNWVDSFYDWFEGIFRGEILPLIQDFEYCYEGWFNGLTNKQQAELLKVDTSNQENLKNKYYTMFCKCEKQMADGLPNKYPKNRCICGPNAEYKYVMGPIVHRLETIFTNFKGYCGGKNWSEMESLLNKWYKQGYTKVIEGDGSGFDRTQHTLLKDVERTIYRHLLQEGKIHHVDEDVFAYHSETDTVKIKSKSFMKNGKYTELQDYGHIEITGTVLSGSMDTTFANTLRMALYNRFVLEKVMGLSAEQYQVIAKGDDFAVFVNDSIMDEEITDAYYKVFSNKTTRTHGLGQILKFVRIASYATMDFCCTEAFNCTKCGWKIVRQLPRFLTLTPYSSKVLALSKDEEMHYKHQLFMSNLKWMDGLPVFTEYNNQLMHKVFNYKVKTKTGKQKMYLNVPKKYQHLYVKTSKQIYKEELIEIFGKDAAYSMADRTSDKCEQCVEGYYKHLQYYYNLSRQEVNTIQRDLSRVNYNYDYSIDVINIREACDYRKNYVANYDVDSSNYIH